MHTFKNILLVDDNDDDAFLIDRAFSVADIAAHIFRCIDGEETINYLLGKTPFTKRSHYPSPDLVLLDLKFPGKSGFDILAWIRHQKAFQSLIVVILTCSARRSEVEKAYALHANSYLVKPVSLNSMIELAHCINTCWLQNLPRMLH